MERNRRDASRGYLHEVSRLWRNWLRPNLGPPEGGASTSRDRGRFRSVERCYSFVVNRPGRGSGDDSEPGDEAKGGRRRGGYLAESETAERVVSPGETPRVGLLWRLTHGAPKFPKHDGLATVFLIAGVILFLFQFKTVKKQIEVISHAQAPPIIFPKPWKPEQPYYHPGDRVRFVFMRDTKGQTNLILYQCDSFENEDTGELYRGENLGHIAQADSDVPIHAVRFLPAKIEPGPYHLEGWVSSQTEVRSMAGIYTSERFWVVPKGETLEKFMADRKRKQSGPLFGERPD